MKASLDQGPTSFTRSFWVCLLLLPLLGWAFHATRFGNRLEIESGQGSVRFGVDGQWIEEPVDLGGLRQIKLKVAPSFFPIAIEKLVLKTPAGTARNLVVPPVLPLRPSSRSLTGDWWADRGCEPEVVYQESLSVSGAFSLSGVGRGRSLEAIEIRLEGPNQSCRMFYRSGHLSNDFGFVKADGSISAENRAGQPARDWFHLSHHLFGTLFWGCLLTVVFRITQRYAFTVKRPVITGFHWNCLVAVLLAAGFMISLWVAISILDKRPHFQDDVGYLLRAKWLLEGNLKMPVPPNAEHFAIPYTVFTKNGWISQYTLGWPLLLAAGEAVGMPWLMAPLCGLLLAYVTWKLGGEAGGKAVGVVAVVLEMASPLWQLLVGSMLSHAAAALFLALFTWLYIRGWRKVGDNKNSPSLLLSGLALGFAFNVRPLSAVAFAIPAAIFGLIEMRRARFSRLSWLGLVSVILGGVGGAMLQILDNYYVTGDFFTFAYSMAGDPGWSFKNYISGIYLSEPMFALVPSLAFGWGWPLPSIYNWLPMLGMGLASIVFLTARATKTDWFLGGLFLSLGLLYMGYQGTGLHGFGPRYLSDCFFAFFILSARGLKILCHSSGPSKITFNRCLAGAAISLCILGVLLTMTSRFAYYKGYNESDDRVEKALSEAGINQGLILLSGPEHIMWARVGRMLSFRPDSKIIFALYKENNQGIIASHPGMPVYIVSDAGVLTYNKPTTTAFH